MRRLAAMVVLSALAMPFPAAAQQDPDRAPKVLIIRREDVKPGQSIAHEKSESVRIQALERMGATHVSIRLAKIRSLAPDVPLPLTSVVLNFDTDSVR